MATRDMKKLKNKIAASGFDSGSVKAALNDERIARANDTIRQTGHGMRLDTLRRTVATDPRLPKRSGRVDVDENEERESRARHMAADLLRADSDRAGSVPAAAPYNRQEYIDTLNARTEEMRQELADDAIATGKLPEGYYWHTVGGQAYAVKDLAHAPLVTTSAAQTPRAFSDMTGERYVNLFADIDNYNALVEQGPELPQESVDYLNNNTPGIGNARQYATHQNRVNNAQTLYDKKLAEAKQARDAALALLGPDAENYAGKGGRQEYLRYYFNDPDYIDPVTRDANRGPLKKLWDWTFGGIFEGAYDMTIGHMTGTPLAIIEQETAGKEGAGFFNTLGRGFTLAGNQLNDSILGIAENAIDLGSGLGRAVDPNWSNPITPIRQKNAEMGIQIAAPVLQNGTALENILMNTVSSGTSSLAHMALGGIAGAGVASATGLTPGAVNPMLHATKAQGAVKVANMSSFTLSSMTSAYDKAEAEGAPLWERSLRAVTAGLGSMAANSETTDLAMERMGLSVDIDDVWLSGAAGAKMNNNWGVQAQRWLEDTFLKHGTAEGTQEVVELLFDKSIEGAWTGRLMDDDFWEGFDDEAKENYFYGYLSGCIFNAMALPNYAPSQQMLGEMVTGETETTPEALVKWMDQTAQDLKDPVMRQSALDFMNEVKVAGETVTLVQQGTPLEEARAIAQAGAEPAETTAQETDPAADPLWDSAMAVAAEGNEQAQDAFDYEMPLDEFLSFGERMFGAQAGEAAKTPAMATEKYLSSAESDNKANEGWREAVQEAKVQSNTDAADSTTREETGSPDQAAMQPAVQQPGSQPTDQQAANTPANKPEPKSPPSRSKGKKTEAETTHALQREQAAMVLHENGSREAVRMTGVEKVEDGEVYVRVTNEAGKTTVERADDMDFDGVTGELMAADVTGRMDAHGVQAYLDGYNDTVASPTEYANAYSGVYARAKAGMLFNEAVGKSDTALRYLTREAAEAAYLAGNRAYNVEHDIVTGNDAVMQKRVLDKLNEKLSGRIILTDRDFGGNAMYDANNNFIYVSTKADKGAYLYAAVHEVGHMIKANNAEAWSRLESVMTDALRKNGVDIEERIAAAMEQYKRTMNRQKITNEQDRRDYAREEVMCNTLASILQDKQVVQEMVRQDRTLMERIVQAVKDVLDKMTKTIQSLGDDLGQLNGWKQMQVLKDDHASLQKMYDTMMGALEGVKDEAGADAQKQHGVKLSASATKHYDYSNSFAQQVDDWIAGKIPSNDTLLVCKTPEVFQKIGLGSLPMTINQTHVDYAVNGTKNADHHMGAAMLKKLPDLLEEPIAIIESATRPKDSLVAVVSGMVNGKQMMAAIEVNGVGVQNGEDVDVNVISSTQGRSNTVTKLLTDALNKENAGQTSVYYLNKKKAYALYPTSGVQFPGSHIQDGHVHSIFDAGSPVNRIFMEQTDTQQFKRWFGKSKIVNEDGSPKIVYHGTASDFWAFDHKKANDITGRRLGLGAGKGKFYLTEHKGSGNAAAMSAQQMGKGGQARVMELYVSAQKVMDRSEYDSRLQEMYAKYPNSNPHEDGYDYRQRDKAIAALDKAVRKEGYDCVWDKEGGELFVYEATQMKSATDNVGLFDPENKDIRYSLRETEGSVDTEMEESRKKYAGKNLAYDSSLYDYDFLASLPDIQVVTEKSLASVLDRNRAIDYKKLDEEAMKNAEKYGFIMTSSENVVLITNRYTGHQLRVTKDGATHSTHTDSKAANLANARASMVIGELVMNAVPINALKDKKKDVRGTYLMAAPMESVDGKYKSVVAITVEMRTSNIVGTDVYDQVHAASVRKRNGVVPTAEAAATNVAAPGNTPATRSNSYSMPDFLQIVNTTHQSALSDNVLEHFDEVRNPNGHYTDKVKFSLRETDETVQEELATLKELHALTSAHRMTDKEAGWMARRVLKDAQSDYDAAQLAAELKHIFDYAERGNGISVEQMDSELNQLAEKVLAQSKTLDEEHEERMKPIRDFLRTNAISLTETQQKEAAHLVGSIGQYRRMTFGRAKLTNKGVPLDSVWESLTELDPEMFPADATEGEMAALLLDAVDATAPVYLNDYGFNAMEQTQWLAGQMSRQYFALSGVQAAVKEQGQLNMPLKNYRKLTERFAKEHKAVFDEAMGKVKAQAQEEIAQAEKKAEARIHHERLEAQADAAIQTRKQVAAVKQQADAEREDYMAAMKLKNKEWREGYREQAKETSRKQRYRGQIVRMTNELVRRLEKPTDKKHVQSGLAQTLVDFLGSLDLGGKNKATRSLAERITALRTEYAKAQAGANAGSGEGYIIDQRLLDDMEKMTAELAGMDSMNKLNADQMRDMRDMVKHAMHVVNTADISFVQGNKERISEMAVGSLAEMSTRPKYKNKKGKIDARRILQADMLDSFTYFERLGKTAQKVFGGLRKGFDQRVEKLSGAIDCAHELVEAAKAAGVDKTIFTDKAPTQTFTIKRKETAADGTTTEVEQQIELTKAQVMSLYLLNKRDQAKQHIYSKTGGIRTQDDPETVQVTEADVLAVVGTLSEAEKALADGLQQYMTTECTDWGNQTSQTLFGYQKFTEKNYFPIRVDPNSTTSMITDDGKAENLWGLLNMGFTKPTSEQAGNALILDSVIDVFTQHVDDMSSYYAFAPAVADMVRWYNWRSATDKSSIKGMLEEKFGSYGRDYIPTLIRDLNGENKKSKSPVSKIVQMFTRAGKSASVGGNLSVFIQQASAIARASMMISPKWITAATATAIGKTNRAKEQAKKWCPIANWKSMGFYETHIGKSLGTMMFGGQSLKEKAIDLSMKGAGWVDETTFGILWCACEMEQKALHPDLKGDELYKVVGKRLGDIIDRTQVVDSPLHRAQVMRSKDDFLQMLTAFKSEPMKTYNMLLSAIDGFAQDRKNPAARAKLCRAVTTYMASSVLNALLQSVVGAMRDDDEDESYWEKYLQALIGDYSNVKGFWGGIGEALNSNLVSGMNPLNWIPLMGDLVSIAQGYDPSRMDMQGVQKLYDFADQLVKAANGDSTWSFWKWVKNGAGGFSYMTGIPMESLIRDCYATVSTISMAFGGKPVPMQTETATLSTAAGNLYDAALEGNTKKWNRIVGKLHTQDTPKSDAEIDTAIAKELRESDDRVAAAYEAKTAGSATEVARIRAEVVKDLTSGGVLSEERAGEIVDKAITGFKPEGETEEPKVVDTSKQLTASLYTTKDATSAVLSLCGIGGGTSSQADFDLMLSELIADSTAKDPSKTVKQNIRNSLKGEYISLVEAGKTDEANALKQFMIDQLDGNEKTIDGWVK